MSEEDEIKQDVGERQMAEVARTDEPASPSESGAAEDPVAAVPDAIPETVEPMSATAEETLAPIEVSEGERMESAQVEAAVEMPQAESEIAPEPVVEAMVETGSDEVTAADETEATSEESKVELPSLDQAPQVEPVEAEPAMAPVAEVEVETAPQVEEAEPEAATLAAATTISQPEEAVAEQAESADVDDDRHWYVVHCYSGYENKVRHNLEQRIESMGMKDKIFDVVVPTEEEIEVKEGKRRTVERRVFPGYILVQMIMTEESWYVVRNTPGVTGFVGMGNEPTPLRPEEVAQIIRRMEAEAPRVKVTYKIDQKVRIIDGPFNDFIGTVELDFLQVEKA
jgi:transcriptional antiterminator NusG